MAGFAEVLVEGAHHEVDVPSVLPADEAAEGVASHVEGERGVVVVVEGAEGFVLPELEPQPLRDPLNGKVAKLLQFKLIHNYHY